MPRTKEFDSTKALEDALGAFMVKGYESTSIQDLIDATGVCRQSLYNEFGDKREIFLKALSAYCAIAKERTAAILSLDRPAREVLDTYKEFLRGHFKNQDGAKGCLVVSSIMGTSNEDPEAQRIRTTFMAAKVKMIEEVIARGQRSGEISNRRPASILAREIEASIIGVAVLARGGAEEKELKGLIDAMFDGLG